MAKLDTTTSVMETMILIVLYVCTVALILVRRSPSRPWCEQLCVSQMGDTQAGAGIMYEVIIPDVVEPNIIWEHGHWDNEDQCLKKIKIKI